MSTMWSASPSGEPALGVAAKYTLRTRKGCPGTSASPRSASTRETMPPRLWQTMSTVMGSPGKACASRCSSSRALSSGEALTVGWSKASTRPS